VEKVKPGRPHPSTWRDNVNIVKAKKLNSYITVFRRKNPADHRKMYLSDVVILLGFDFPVITGTFYAMHDNPGNHERNSNNRGCPVTWNIKLFE
jgi:hypothetical protein